MVLVVVPLVLPPNDIGLGSGLLASCRNVLGTIGSAIYISVFGNELPKQIRQHIPPAVISAGLPPTSVTALLAAYRNGTTAALRAVPGYDTAVGAAYAAANKTAYFNAFKLVYLASLSFGAVAVIVAFFARDVDHLMTGFLNKRVDGRYDATRENTVEVQTEGGKAA